MKHNINLTNIKFKTLPGYFHKTVPIFCGNQIQVASLESLIEPFSSLIFFELQGHASCAIEVNNI